MGLFDKLSDLLGSKNNFNLLVVGLDNSGKTSVINYFKPGDAKSSVVSSTVGFNVEKFFAKSINFTAYDMSGQSRYRNLWEHYYKEVDAIVFVLDSSDHMRIVVAKEELDSMIDHADMRSRNIPLLIYANKCDVRDSKPTSEIRLELDIDRVRNRPWRIFASNAITGEGMWPGMDWLIAEIKKAQH